MPVYQYRCRNPECRREFEQVHETNRRHRGRCPKCGARAKKLLTVPQVGGFRERDIELWNGGAKRMDTVHVASRADVERECDKRDLIHRGYHYHDRVKPAEDQKKG